MQPRGDIWLHQTRGGPGAKLSSGADWHWAPSFSPSGRSLAALASNGDGKTGLAVWNRPTRRGYFHDLDLDIYVSMQAHGQDQSWPSPQQNVPKQFAWLDDEHILCVGSATQPLLFEHDGLRADEVFSNLRARTARGELSVRQWTDQAPTCGTGRTLWRVRTGTGAVEILFRGDIRGVSLSPDGRTAAVLTAASHNAPMLSAPMTAGLQYFSSAGDPLVSHELWLVSLGDGRMRRRVRDFSGCGMVGPQRLPRWSADASACAIPSRLSHSSRVANGDDFCFVVNAETAQARSYRADTPLDAEIIAATAQCDSMVRDVLMDIRPRFAATDASLRVGEIEGAAWTLDRSSILIRHGDKLLVLRPGGVEHLEGEFSAVFQPTINDSHAVAVAIRNAEYRLVTITNVLATQHPTGVTSNYQLIGQAPKANQWIFKQDSEAATEVVALTPNLQTTPVTSRNQHLAVVDAPISSILRSSSNPGSLSGVLQLPPTHRNGERHPVLMWAYPNSFPTLASAMTRLNNPAAIWRPLQYLLAKGYAVFYAPLPMHPAQGRFFEQITTQLHGWLDVLARHNAIDASRCGFYGHSNAGYAALALEVSSHRFKAIVAHATFPDIGFANLTAAPDRTTLDCAPYTIQADRFYYEDEAQPYGVGAPFWLNPGAYAENSPAIHLDAATTPLLLLAGEFDSGSREMEGVYSTLLAKGVPVEMALYWGEGHVLNTPGNLHDMWLRTERFLDRNLRRSH